MNYLTQRRKDAKKSRIKIGKAFLIAKPMRKASWTKCCGVGGGSVDGWGGTVAARRLAGLIG